MLIDITGDYALFTRPEFKVERLSYDVITPSAARGIIEAVYWKPAIKYVIDKIHVYNEPEFMTIKRNEVSKKISCNAITSLMSGVPENSNFNTTTLRQQRVSTLLKNVHYVIDFHFDMTHVNSEKQDETPEKHYNILKRRLLSGQCFNQPCLGCREFSAAVTLLESGVAPKSELKGTQDLGYMLYDLEYPAVKHISNNGVRVINGESSEIKPVFFKAIMQDGVIDLTNIKTVR